MKKVKIKKLYLVKFNVARLKVSNHILGGTNNTACSGNHQCQSNNHADCTVETIDNDCTTNPTDNDAQDSSFICGL